MKEIKAIKKTNYAFRVSREYLIAFSRLSAEEKLAWLEEVNRFINDFVPKEKLEKWKEITGSE
jgi:hypothetical protein